MPHFASKNTILIVDDEPVNIKALEFVLGDEHNLVYATTGEMALDMARSEPQPDLILMDIVMPGLNGFQATRQLTKDAETSHIPVIIVTTKDQETDKVWGKRQGAKDYLTKPVDEDTLVKTLNAVLAG